MERTVMGGKTVYDRAKDAARVAAYVPDSYHLCGDGDEADEGKIWP